MTYMTDFLAQLLHLALMAAAAPTLIGVMQWQEARLAGRPGPPVLQPWRDLMRLLRKQTMLSEAASGLGTAALAVAAAATAVAACMVPSFALGMTSAPVADLPTIGALLALARAAQALAVMDVGTGEGGLGASRSTLLGCLAEPALLLAVFVLALIAGSSNLPLIAAMQIEVGMGGRASSGLALAAAVLAVLADVTRRSLPADDFSGRDLGLMQATEAMRLLVWFDLIAAAFVPYGIASPVAGPAAWPIGLATWLLRTLLLGSALSLLYAVVGRMPLVRVARMLGVAMVLGLLAVALLFSGMRTA